MNKRAEAEGLAPRKTLTLFIESEVTDGGEESFA